jgi:hypothetical protein
MEILAALLITVLTLVCAVVLLVVLLVVMCLPAILAAGLMARLGRALGRSPRAMTHGAWLGWLAGLSWGVWSPPQPDPGPWLLRMTLGAVLGAALAGALQPWRPADDWREGRSRQRF